MLITLLLSASVAMTLYTKSFFVSLSFLLSLTYQFSRVSPSISIAVNLSSTPSSILLPEVKTSPPCAPFSHPVLELSNVILNFVTEGVGVGVLDGCPPQYYKQRKPKTS